LQNHTHGQKVHCLQIRLGVETVAIYSDIDRSSKFVDMADKAYRVGNNPSCKFFVTQLSLISTEAKFYRLPKIPIVKLCILVLDSYPKMQDLQNNVQKIT